MGKIGKTFTIDIDVYNWLEQHAKDKNRKVSYIVNLALRKIRSQTEKWICPKCDSSNNNQYTDCHNCSYVKVK